MKVAVLFSGGKDSNLALWYAVHQGWNIQLLITIHPHTPESYMFHYPNIEWVQLQAESLGYPIQIIPIKDDKEDEIIQLEEKVRQCREECEFDGVISGAVESEYQKSRIDRICEHLGVRSFAPLWKKNPYTLLQEEVAMGFKILITAYSASGFDRKWLGRTLDTNVIEEIARLSEKWGVNPIFEGGEAETFVVDAPLFHTPIKITSYEKVWGQDEGQLRIKEAELISQSM